MIRSLLVANRGEIARRVFRTCRELGVSTVAVHSDADADAPHVREADTAVRLPGEAPADTYLRGDLLVRAARSAGADAVHPGYGFLSENAAFAAAVTEAGLAWIGPPPAAIEAMASKTRAKELMAGAGVPLLAPLDPAAATEADLPLLVKAAAGGGGRGMRLVTELGALDEELTAAKGEAAAAFGDGEVFVEPYVVGGRHVEVQILADAHGTVWTLGTRDCSLQRRHQKVIEEAPAPGLSDELRTTLHQAAEQAARAIGYRGAGTVEFLVSADGRAYFLEMNTRLQVEHPVTEAVHGLDLVALQLSIAEGHPLDAEPPRPHGHAVEARLYAEDPAAGWQPQTGTLHRLELPDGVRLDSGVTDGDTIGVHYDPMLAKVIAWAPTRDAAVRKLAGALERARIHGPVTNRDLLVRSLRHPEFTHPAALDTGFYDRNLPALTEPADAGAGLFALAAALADAHGRSRFGGFRNVPSGPQTKTYTCAGTGTAYEIRYRLGRDGLSAEDFPGVRLLALGPDEVVLEADGLRRPFTVARYGDRVHVDAPPAPGAPATAPASYAFTALPRFPDPTARTEPGSLLAPMPGTVVRIAEGLTEGDRVETGQPLLWLEAMKMEHKITAPAAGTLSALPVRTGQQVEVGALLAVVAETAEASETAEATETG
ncbi:MULTISPECIES: biotin carboxylase N-terminal domain-containing protein [unclassified Streptomyces]|uniref:acetyl/propionyl/methylcrotonyl-CoA carboxylase subunit alpha n=1 Tax=unclassified Streptomyces TaxID=2593676 RepID=UPI000889DBE1|nr:MULTISPECIES: biotin carboxylase N-terminal domain-containing protein [unclassified Streptomyces]PBC84443.1 propionyl-CoA carboxylase alpha chain [Streptomyces sp. 2321.6]SDR30726.1 propionyl-CoA carboxylase alpha chain [Streptomyces sp. KS_16]SED31550.1 propionyl-CoA carboxylase alpha chain [Streptomyces sp. 2133.1]SNC70526.1 propionyl-CoA carboxylase alpha chain [Streptomyces sp. 2114.4]